MTLSKNAIGNLINKYRAVLSKCRLLNTFSSLAVAGVLVLGMGGAGMAADSGLKFSSPNSFIIVHSGTDYDSAEEFQAGEYSSTGDATGGDVKIDSGNAVWSIHGGYAEGAGNNAIKNSVTMEAGTAKYIYGGFSDSDANDNTVSVSGGTISNAVFGGRASSSVNNNTVTVSGGTISNVYGGSSSNGDVDNNKVIISGGTINGSVYGASTRGSARNNTVIFSGGTIGKNLYGGNGRESSNNTLVIEGKGRSVGGEVDFFQNFVFNLPANVAVGDTILEVGTSGTGEAKIDGTTVDVKLADSPSELNAGDSITLIDKTGGGTVTFANGKDAISQNYGFLESNGFSLEVSSAANNPLLLNYDGIRYKDNPYATNGDGLNDYIKAAQDRGEIGEAFVNDMSKPAGARFLSRAISSSYGNATIDAAKAVESAMHLATIGAVPHMALWANQAAANAVTQRTSLAMPEGNMLQSTTADSGNGLNSGDEISGLSAGNNYDKTGFAMWIMPLWQSNNLFGMKTGDNLTADIHANLGGVALGADYTWDKMFRFGLTFNIGGGYAEGSGDFAKTTNDMNFWGVGAYAGLAYNNFGLTADVSYTSTFNSIKQELDSSFAMQDPESDVRAYAISAGLRGEYTFELANLNITPHAGVRYTSLFTDSYDVESGGGTIVEADKTSQGIWTFPIGVQFAKSFEMDNGWYVKPSLDVVVTPAAGDIENKRDVRFTGVSGSLTADAQIMDWMSYGGQAGLEFGNDNMKLGVNYNLQAGAHSTNHGVFGTFRYEF